MSEQINELRIPLRFKFQKLGPLKYISHLDLMRTMRRALARAKVPLAYSCGFNPHPKMTFALPLSLGSESVCEYMDIAVTEDIPKDELLCRCNEVLPSELQILSIDSPVCGLDKIGYSEYEIRVLPANPEQSEMAFTEYLQSPVMIEKKTKSGIKTIDITERILRCEFKKADNELTICAALCADNDRFLNPELLVSAFDKAALLQMNEGYSILRTEILQKDGKTPFR